jgi:hypothetical protein
VERRQQQRARQQLAEGAPLRVGAGPDGYAALAIRAVQAPVAGIEAMTHTASLPRQRNAKTMHATTSSAASDQQTVDIVRSRMSVPRVNRS